MRGQVHVLQPQQRIRRAERLRLVHIDQRHSPLVPTHERRQRARIHNEPARRVEEDHRVTHQRKRPRIHQPPVLRPPIHVHRQHIRLPQQHFARNRPRPMPRALRNLADVVINHLHLHRRRDPRHRRADPAEPIDPHHHLVEFAIAHQLPPHRVPRRGIHRAIQKHPRPRRIRQEREHILNHRPRVRIRRAHNLHAPCRTRRQIKVVQANPRPPDHPQPRGPRQERIVHDRVRPHHQGIRPRQQNAEPLLIHAAPHHLASLRQPPLRRGVQVLGDHDKRPLFAHARRVAIAQSMRCAPSV